MKPQYRKLMQRAAIAGAAFVFAAGAQAQGWQPERNVEIVVNTAPGSGPDVTARLIQRILQDLKAVPTSLTVANKPGGGGGIAYGYLSQHAGDGQFVAIASKSLLTNHISGRMKLTYSNLTPLAILFGEYITVGVKADSPIKDGRDLIQRMKQDPASLSFGVATSLGNPNHQGVAMAMKASGIDLRKTKTVVFQSGGNAITALLGGHVDVVPGSVGLMRKHVEAGSVRLVAIASPQRLGGIYANTPTWKEQGADVIVSNWRGMVGPGGMTAAQKDYWDNALKQLTQTEAWKKELAKNNWADEYRQSAETLKYMEAEYAELKSFLTELGLVKTK